MSLPTEMIPLFWLGIPYSFSMELMLPLKYVKDAVTKQPATPFTRMKKFLVAESCRKELRKTEYPQEVSFSTS